MGGTGGDRVGDGVGGQNNGLRQDGNRLRQNLVRKGDTESTRVQARGRKGRSKNGRCLALKQGNVMMFGATSRRSRE